MALDRGLHNITEDCTAVADVAGQLVCTAQKMEALLANSVDTLEKPIIYDIDHHYPGGEANKVCAFKYHR